MKHDLVIEIENEPVFRQMKIRFNFQNENRPISRGINDSQ